MDKITAAEAKTLADSSEVLKKRVYKCIKEAALEGLLSCRYNLGEDVSPVLIESLKGDLVAHGFDVSIISEDENWIEFFISWNVK